MPASSSPDRRPLIIDPAVFRAIADGPPRPVAAAALVIGAPGAGKTAGPSDDQLTVQS